MMQSSRPFIIAAFWAPVIVTVLAGLSSGAAGPLAILFSLLYSTFFSFCGSLAIGRPSFSIFWARRHTSWWSSTILGSVICAAIGWIAFVVFAISSSQPVPIAPVQTTTLFLAIGALYGCTAWWLARPDQMER